MGAPPQARRPYGWRGTITSRARPTRNPSSPGGAAGGRGGAVSATGILYAGAATVILAVTLTVLFWGTRRLEAWLEQRSQRDPGRFSWLLEPIRRIVRFVRVGGAVLLILLYIPFALAVSVRTDRFRLAMEMYVRDLVASAGRAFVDYLPNLGFVIFAVLLVILALRLLRPLFVEVGRGRLRLGKFKPSWAVPTYKLARFVLIVFAAILVFPRLPGASTDSFQGISLFVGLLVSLGASSAIANIIAGVVLTYTGAFERGDRVRIAETLGDVVDRALFVTRIRTIKNEEIAIPNSLVLGSHIINYSQEVEGDAKGVIVPVQVSIGYDVPWRRVYELLAAAAPGVEGVLGDPAPFVLQKKLDDFYVVYELNAYTDKPNSMARIASGLNEAIRDAFDEADIAILSPHYRTIQGGAAPDWAPGAPAEAPAVGDAPDGGADAAPSADSGAPLAEPATEPASDSGAEVPVDDDVAELEKPTDSGGAE